MLNCFKCIYVAQKVLHTNPMMKYTIVSPCIQFQSCDKDIYRVCTASADVKLYFFPNINIL